MYNILWCARSRSSHLPPYRREPSFPESECMRNPTKRQFNTMLSKPRVSIERAFGKRSIFCFSAVDSCFFFLYIRLIFLINRSCQMYLKQYFQNIVEKLVGYTLLFFHIFVMFAIIDVNASCTSLDINVSPAPDVVLCLYSPSWKTADSFSALNRPFSIGQEFKLLVVGPLAPK